MLASSLGPWAFALALGFAAAMGVAIQRGSVCTVDAVGELVTHRRATRLIAMIEASLWVCGGLMLAHRLGVVAEVPSDSPLTRWTVVGGALLGVGAVINGACAIGTIARLGSGEWSFAAMPIGFYFGNLSAKEIFGVAEPVRMQSISPIFSAPSWLVWTFIAVGVWRMANGCWSVRRSRTMVWTPHACTAIIGIASLMMLLLVGAWSYTDMLAEVSRGMSERLVSRVALALAVVTGACTSGLLARRFIDHKLTLQAVARCLSGGLLMGWGGALVPGGNDAIVLLAMPLLWLYAWVTFAIMCAVIAAFSRAVPRRLLGPGDPQQD